MAMGHVILREFLVDRQVPYFADPLTRFADAPFLVVLEPKQEVFRPGKFLTADALGRELEPTGDERAEVGFDDPLVLRRGRDDLRVGDGAVGADGSGDVEALAGHDASPLAIGSSGTRRTGRTRSA
jgi:nitrate reductase alpha subunit